MPSVTELFAIEALLDVLNARDVHQLSHGMTLFQLFRGSCSEASADRAKSQYLPSTLL